MFSDYKRRRGERVALGDQVLEERPEIAKEVARIAGAWSQLEMEMSKLFSTLLINDNDAAFDMFHELHDLKLRQTLFMAAGKHVLEQSDRVRLQHLGNRVREVADGRNAVVHGLWALGSKTKKDQILLCEDRVVNRHFGDYLEYAGAHGFIQALKDVAANVKPGTPKEEISQRIEAVTQKRIDRFNATRKINDFKKCTLKDLQEIRKSIYLLTNEIGEFGSSVLQKVLAQALQSEMQRHRNIRASKQLTAESADRHRTRNAQ